MIATAALLASLPSTADALSTSLGGEFWGRWTMEQGKSPVSDDNLVKKNFFALERGYVDLKTTFTESTKARFAVDLFSTDALADGAGLKLKYGYVDFANLIPVKDMVLSAGLQKVYFGTIWDWDYTLIGKAPTDEYKVANSADYGVTLNGYLPAGFGSYAVGIYNGEGYKNFGANLKDNIDPAFLGNVRLTPIAGLTLGGSVMSNSVQRDQLLADDTDNASRQEQMLLDGMVKGVYGSVEVSAEYISKDVSYPHDSAKDYTANCITVIPVVNLYKLIGTDIQLVGRFDRWDESDNPSSMNLLNAITGGVNYNIMHDDSFVPAMQVQFNVTKKTYDEDNSAAGYANAKKDALQAMLQLKWRFSSTIQ
jgi:hypothetical protein